VLSNRRATGLLLAGGLQATHRRTFILTLSTATDIDNSFFQFCGIIDGFVENVEILQRRLPSLIAQCVRRVRYLNVFPSLIEQLYGLVQIVIVPAATPVKSMTHRPYSKA
jgi:hypothetical protein